MLPCQTYGMPRALHFIGIGIGIGIGISAVAADNYLRIFYLAGLSDSTR